MRTRTLLAATTALTLGFAAPVFAKDEVTLRSQDGIDVTGTIVSFEDNVYVIRTDLGILRVSGERVDCFGDACPDVSEVETVASDEVTLRAADGSTQITGKLLSFENDAYLLETSFGKLQIAAAGNTCIGKACPEVNLNSKEVTIASSGELSSGLMMSLVNKFAERQDMQLGRSKGQDGNELIVLSGANGQTLAEVSMASSSSTEAVKALLGGGADLAATTRSVREEEREALIGANADDITRSNAETVLALDALAIVVHPDNPVQAVSQRDLAKIFSAKITDWSQLGGNPGTINIYGREDDTGTTEVFNNLVMDPARTEISGFARLMDSDRAVSDAVVGDPRGIGFTSFSALADAKSLAIRGECGIQTPANAFTIKTEEYPLARRIYMYRPLNSIPQSASDFLDFVKSTEAQEIVTQAGFVGQDVTSVSVNEQGLRFISSVLPTDADATYEQIQEMLTDLVAAERLSLTFRFEPGSARLDTRSQADVQRLAAMIENGDFDRKEILVVGFTDSIGLGDINIGLSQARAEQVKNAVLGATSDAATFGKNMNAIGYGEMSPLGCNDTLNGRAINRRVEIWTKDIIGNGR